MKTLINLCFVSAVLFIHSSFLYSQNQTDLSKIIPGKKYKIVLIDDSEVLGTVMATDTVNVTIKTENNNTMIIPKNNILYYSTDFTLSKYKFSLSLLGGVSVFSGDHSYNYNSSGSNIGLNIDLMGIYFLSDSKAVKIDAGFTFLKPKYDNNYYNPYGSAYQTTFSGGDVFLYSLKANLLIGTFKPVNRTILYASFGIGIHLTKQKEIIEHSRTQHYPDTTWNEIIYTTPDRNDFNALLSIGAGFGYRFTEHFGLKAEIEYNMVTSSYEFLFFSGRSYFPMRAGIFYIF